MNTLDKIKAVIRLFKNAFARHSKKILIMLALGFIGGFLGGIGIGAVIPLFYIITNQSGAGTDSMSIAISRAFEIIHLPMSITTILIMMALLFIAKAVFLYIANYINSRIYVEYELETRDRLFKKTLDTGWPYLMNQKMGHLNSILMDDVGGISGALNNLSAAFLTSTSLITYAIIALNISAPITILTLALGAVMFLLLKPIFYKVRKLSGRTSETVKKLAHHINQHVAGAKTIKSMSLENEVFQKGISYFEDLKDIRLQWSRYGVLFNTFIEPISLGFVVAIFLTSYRDPNFNIATFVAIIYLVQKMFSFVQSIQAKFNNINEALPLINVLVSYEKEIDKHRELPGGDKKFIFNGSLDFENVSFSYSDQEVIKSMNFSAKKGEAVGLIGPSGAGKTTVVDLILRLFRPQKGQIKIDGLDINEINISDWRKNIGYVSQDNFLLNDTVENNIRFYAENIPTEDIREAAKLANILDFIEELPEKFQTVIGERGVLLSGGQRQRIILARILARKPQLLILDEATSALDNESEQKIQKAIEDLFGKITIIIIAHRLSTVMGSDKILVLNNGIIQESGKPQELLNDKESYLYKNYYLNSK